MLHDTMADNLLSLYCLVDGDVISKACSLAIPSTETVGQLRSTIHLSKPVWFKELEAEDLTLWSVSIPDDDDDDDDDDDEDLSICLDNIPNKKKLKATRELSDVFHEKPAKRMIHIIVQRPPRGNADALSSITTFMLFIVFTNLNSHTNIVHTPIPARASTPLPGYLSDNSRPGTPLSGECNCCFFICITAPWSFHISSFFPNQLGDL